MIVDQKVTMWNEDALVSFAKVDTKKAPDLWPGAQLRTLS